MASNTVARIICFAALLPVAACGPSELDAHCQNKDGEIPSLVLSFKETLEDPESFEHVETIVSPAAQDDGTLWAFMDYRARNNSTGVLVDGTVRARVQNDNCTAAIQ